VNAGCTAVVSLRVDDDLYVANAGDSRAVLCRMGVAIDLSLDHKPSQVREFQRITNAGGFVNSACRVNGNLNLSRAIGDLKYKKVAGVHRKDQIITADPDITVTKLEPGDEFVILACDGIWDCFTSQECVDFVRARLDDGIAISQIIKDVSTAFFYLFYHFICILIVKLCLLYDKSAMYMLFALI
jgi:protein phosphatase 1G